MSEDRVARIVGHYRRGLYSFQSAERELVVWGFTPTEASGILRDPKQPVAWDTVVVDPDTLPLFPEKAAVEKSENSKSGGR